MVPIVLDGLSSGDRGAISLQSVASTVCLESITFLLTILALLRWSILGHRAAASVVIRQGSVEGLAVFHLWLKAVSFLEHVLCA